MIEYLQVKGGPGEAFFVKRKKFLWAAVFFLLLWANNTSMFADRQGEYKLLAHRGLAQTFDVSAVEWDTNTAEIIDEPDHPFLENTIESMEAA